MKLIAIDGERPLGQYQLMLLMVKFHHLMSILSFIDSFTSFVDSFVCVINMVFDLVLIANSRLLELINLSDLDYYDSYLWSIK